MGGSVHTTGSGAANPWNSAIDSVSLVKPRSEIVLSECAAPGRLAPHALAMTADILEVADDGIEDEVATGKFILLHDPASPEAWQGTFRAVTYIRARIESDLATDPLLDDVIWSWLEEAQESHGVALTNLSGTVTRTLSKSFGRLSAREDENDIEVRASWTPEDTRIHEHIHAWLDALGRCAGLTPLPAGVTSLPLR